jgi:hypothetical protein
LDENEPRMRLQATIEIVRGTLNQRIDRGLPVSSEADTERIIIEPILKALGYEDWEIIQHRTDATTNGRPDYDVFYGKHLRWMLEAKCFGHEFKVNDRMQTVNYANNNGAEWAVLTNGREWEIYSAHLPKPLMEKRVMQINDLFTDANGIETLLLLSRQSMQNEGLKKAWVHDRLVAVVKSQLETPNSVVRKNLRRIGSEEIGTALDDATIGRAIADCGRIGPEPVPTSDAVAPSLALNAPANGLARAVLTTDTETILGHNTYTFSEIAKDSTLTTFRKPKLIEFSDGHHAEVHSWADTAKVIVERISQIYTLPPLPFNTGKGHNYFLNTVAVHEKGNQMISHQVVKIGKQNVYVDTNRSASHLAASIASFLTAAGAPSDAVKVSIASQD